MAASLGKKDLIFPPATTGGWYENTARTKNRSARRYFYIDSLTSGSNAERMKEAADYVDTNYSTYPDDSTLKIFASRAIPLAHPEHALVIASYRKPIDNDPNNDTTIAHIWATIEQRMWWGDPITDLLFVDTEKVKRGFLRDIVIWNIQINTELTTSPLATVGGNVGYVNSNSFALGGHTFSQYELFFAGLDQEVIWDGTNSLFTVKYIYQFRGNNPTGPDGWFESFVTDDATPVLDHRRMHKATTFIDPPLAPLP